MAKKIVGQYWDLCAAKIKNQYYAQGSTYQTNTSAYYTRAERVLMLCSTDWQYACQPNSLGYP
jgi:hypothetical protein